MFDSTSQSRGRAGLSASLFFLSCLALCQPLAAAGNPTAVIHTSKGEIGLELFADQAPISVENFIAYARSGFYVATMGTNVIVIFPGVSSASGVRGAQGSGVTLTVSDALDLKKRIPLLADTAWAKRDVMQIVYGNRKWNGTINGISPGYLTIRDWSAIRVVVPSPRRIWRVLLEWHSSVKQSWRICLSQAKNRWGR